MYVLAKQIWSTCYFEDGVDIGTGFDAGIGIEVKGEGSVRRRNGQEISGLLVKFESERSDLLIPMKSLSKFIVGNEARG
jgi:hypothetical protein